MGRPRKPEKQKAQEKLSELLGIELPSQEEQIQEARQEEAILAYSDNPRLFQRVHCKHCNRKFAVNRKNVAYCGTPCRHKALEKLGIKKLPQDNPTGANDEKWVWKAWNGNEPLVVPPQALEVLSSQSTESVTDTVDTVPETKSTGFADLDDILNS